MKPNCILANWVNNSAKASTLGETTVYFYNMYFKQKTHKITYKMVLVDYSSVTKGLGWIVKNDHSTIEAIIINVFGLLLYFWNSCL